VYFKILFFLRMLVNKQFTVAIDFNNKKIQWKSILLLTIWLPTFKIYF